MIQVNTCKINTLNVSTILGANDFGYINYHTFVFCDILEWPIVFKSVY